MQRVLAAGFAKLFERKFFLDFFLVAAGVIVHFFANIAPETHEIFLRQNVSN